MWPGLVKLAKEGGVDAIETYVFWNGHELSPGEVSILLSFFCFCFYFVLRNSIHLLICIYQYYFGGRYDLVKFAKIVHDAGLYLILRIGPFVAAEWNFGYMVIIYPFFFVYLASFSVNSLT